MATSQYANIIYSKVEYKIGKRIIEVINPHKREGVSIIFLTHPRVN